MPLAFETESHGTIPVGFFNIDSDMLLINNYFIFASELCSKISEWAASEGEIETQIEIYVIKNESDIGDLMGAIRGIIFTGFIGEVYKLYPFPVRHEDFKQKPEGYKTQEQIEEIIRKFAKAEKIDINISKSDKSITIGEYVFNRKHFHEVIGYIWRGGMPMWKNDVRPGYVEDMMKAVLSSKHWFFKDPDSLE